MLLDLIKQKFKKPTHNKRFRNIWQAMHLDMPLLLFLLMLSISGLFILYSSSGRSSTVVELQIVRFLFAFILMLLVAQIPPVSLQRSAPWIYAFGLIILMVVLIIGHIGKGGQRWLSFGIVHFQPSELMKLAIPLLLAWYYHRLQLPVNNKSILISIPIILIPALLTAKQPDLSSASLMVIAGVSVLFFAGLKWRTVWISLFSVLVTLPFIWHFLYDYQRQRVITFLNPENDPLGKGYHIIQSKIAIGSGGLFGKGWLNGTQSSLQFLPEHKTDFIFAVAGEEFGFIGNMILIIFYLLIIFRGLYITVNAQDTFSRLLAGSITLTFFFYMIVNMGMVTGMFPVMGIPLPLISYGGSSMVTIMVSFGILMSIQTHRKLVTT